MKTGITIPLLVMALLVAFIPLVSGQETLDQAWDSAISASRRLQAENSTVAAAQYQQQAATAARLPKLAATSTYTVVSQQPKFVTDVSQTSAALQYLSGGVLQNLPTTLESPMTDKDFSAAVVGVTVPVYTSGKISSLERAGQAMTHAAQAGQKAATYTLKLDVAHAYFTVQRMEKLLEVAKAAKSSLDAHLKDVQNLLQQEMVTKTALLSAQVAQAQAQQNVLRVEFALKTARSAYNRLLWRPLDSPVNLVQLQLPEFSYDIDSLMEAAMTNRPELKQLSAQSRALCEQSKSIRAERMPQVAAGASLSYMENDYVTPDSNWQGTVGVAWAPFDPVNRAKERSVRQESIAVARMRDEAANGIKLQVQKAYNDEQVAREQIRIAQLAVAQSEENLRLVTEQFNQKLATYTQVLDAQTLWTQAHTSLWNATYDALTALYGLRYAVGTL